MYTIHYNSQFFKVSEFITFMIRVVSLLGLTFKIYQLILSIKKRFYFIQIEMDFF